jgi:type IV pilus assembly protein PilC
MKTFELNYSAYADLFNRLALLMHSGVTVGDGLGILAGDEQDKEYAKILSDMSKGMEEGKSFSEVLSSAGCFPSQATGMIGVAERVGRTEETLNSLASYYESRERASQNLRRAITYPSILLLLMMVIIVLLSGKVLPVFDEVYGSFGGSLSGFAGVLLSMGNAINNALPFFGIAAGAIAVIFAIIALVPSASKGVKKAFTRLLGDRGVMRKMNNAQFAQVISVTLASGLTVEEGVGLAADMFSDCPKAAERCKKCQELIENGTEITAALLETELLSQSAARMLTLGIRAGSADSVMEQIASRMSEEAEDALSATIARIEPAMVIITSVLVGIILLSVMLPLLNIMKAIG